MLIIRGGFNMQKRSSFSGKLGFVLAAAGSRYSGISSADHYFPVLFRYRWMGCQILFRICHWFRSRSSGRQLFYRFHWRNIRTDRMVFLVYCSYSSYRWFWCRAGYRKGQQIHDADPRSSDSVRCLIWTDDRRCHGRTITYTTIGAAIRGFKKS